jgi:hypothetical protein
VAEWTGILNTTIRQYIREVFQNIARNRKLLALMTSKGRVQKRQGGGDQFEWRIRYKRATMQGFADSDTLTFPRLDKTKVAALDWRGYASTDSITKKERLINSGKEAIINRFAEMGKQLVDDMMENFGDELYIDGNAVGNDKRIHGIESFMGTTGSAITGTVVMNPSDTYAGLLTNLGNYGGSWSASWPRNGIGPPEYDFWSPLILDYTSTLATSAGGWSNTTATFAARCLEVTRFGIIHTKKNKTMEGQNDAIMYDAEMYRLFVEKLAEKERILVERGGTNKNGLTALGFSDVTNFEGVDVSYEYGHPANVGYGWNSSQVELKSLQNELFVPTGPDYDQETQSHRVTVDFFGNMRFNPRYFWKAQASGTNGA